MWIAMVCRAAKIVNIWPGACLIAMVAPTADAPEAVRSGSVVNPEDAKAFIQETNCRHYFICGSNDQYDSMAVPLIKQLKEAFPSAEIYLAGLPEERKRDEFKGAGTRGYIHVKSDCYETLLTMLNEMEVANNGQ